MSNVNWDGERGGFDDIEYIIEEAEFGFDEKLDAAAGRNVPRFLVRGTAILGDGQRFENSKQGWGIGKFDPVDGGKRAVHESGDESKMFNYQSGYMHFVRAARACGAADVLEARCGGDPLNLRNAEVWVGLKFRLQRLPAGSFKNSEGQQQEYSLLLPTEFLGEVGGAAPAPSSGAGSTQAKNGSTGKDVDLSALAEEYSDKMEYLDEAVRNRGADIAEAEKAWDSVHA